MSGAAPDERAHAALPKVACAGDTFSISLILTHAAMVPRRPSSKVTSVAMSASRSPHDAFTRARNVRRSDCAALSGYV
jgi:hypothetical protein